MRGRGCRAARWPRSAGWEFCEAALREPSKAELDFERKRREVRVAAALARREHRRKGASKP